MDISSVRPADGMIRIRPYGELDLDTAGDMQAIIRQAIGTTGVREVIVDLADVTFCDSSGIAAFDEEYAAAAGRGLRLRVTDPQPGVRRVLEIVGLLDPLTRP